MLEKDIAPAVGADPFVIKIAEVVVIIIVVMGIIIISIVLIIIFFWLSCIEKQHIIREYFNNMPSVAAFILEAPCLNAPFNIDTRTLLYQFVYYLGQPAPCNNSVPVGVFLYVTVSVFPCLRCGKPEGCNWYTAGCEF